MNRLVLVRHGESLWNKENRFTGWTDVDLSPKGIDEAKEAGKLLKRHGFIFDEAYTSVLKRAIETLCYILEELDMQNIPVHRSWRLNERHYGALQGMNKADTAAKFGDAQVRIWRRSYDIRPPVPDRENAIDPENNEKYSDMDKDELPAAESLKDTVARLMPYWENIIAPGIRQGKRLIISAHGNSLRGLIKKLDNISDEEITNLEIPTGKPIIYELDKDLIPIHKYTLK
jgi:2,3-bisphosphoglycerate-dependent phosphoglycerate mutase